jgi:hypothetical protein
MDGHPDLQGIWTNATLTPTRKAGRTRWKSHGD